MHAVMFRSLSIVTLEMQHEREKKNNASLVELRSAPSPLKTIQKLLAVLT